MNFIEAVRKLYMCKSNSFMCRTAMDRNCHYKITRNKGRPILIDHDNQEAVLTENIMADDWEVSEEV